MASDWWAIPLGIVGGLVLIWLAAVIALWLAKPEDARIRESLRLLPDLVRLLKRLAADPEMRARPEALTKHWPGTPDGLAALRRLCRLPESS